MAVDIVLLDSEEKVLNLKDGDHVRLPNHPLEFVVHADSDGTIWFSGGKKDWGCDDIDRNGNCNHIYIRIRTGKKGITRAVWESRTEFWQALQIGKYHVDYVDI